VAKIEALFEFAKFLSKKIELFIGDRCEY